VSIDAKASNRRKQIAQVLVGTLVSVAFLWLAFRKVDWAGVWQSIAHANVWLLLAALGSVVLTTLIRSERWRMMFEARSRRLRPAKFFSIFLIGQVINAIFPARIGELARAYLIGEIEQVSKAYAFWTTVVEKVLDAFILLLFLAGISLVVPLPDWLRQAGWTLSLGVVAVFVGLGLVLVWRVRVARLIERIATRFPWSRHLRLGRLLSAVADSVSLARRPALFGGLVSWSVVAFLVAATTNWLTAQALGLHISYTACLLLLAVLQVTAVVPIPTSPGRVGLFHYLCVISLAIFGVQRDVALGFGLILHLLTYLPMAVGGPLCLWLENYDLRGLSRLLIDKRAEIQS
jgi:glycosyltransferase 2 family protein